MTLYLRGECLGCVFAQGLLNFIFASDPEFPKIGIPRNIRRAYCDEAFSPSQQQNGTASFCLFETTSAIIAHMCFLWQQSTVSETTISLIF